MRGKFPIRNNDIGSIPSTWTLSSKCRIIWRSNCDKVNQETNTISINLMQRYRDGHLRRFFHWIIKSSIARNTMINFILIYTIDGSSYMVNELVTKLIHIRQKGCKSMEEYFVSYSQVVHIFRFQWYAFPTTAEAKFKESESWILRTGSHDKG